MNKRIISRQELCISMEINQSEAYNKVLHMRMSYIHSTAVYFRNYYLHAQQVYSLYKSNPALPPRSTRIQLEPRPFPTVYCITLST